MATSCIDRAVVQLRQASDADLRFLFLVYREIHIGTFKELDLKLREALIGQQSLLQEAHYNEHYSNVERHVIMMNGKPVGRLYASRSEREIVLLDIAILPSYQYRGCGTRVLHKLINEAKTAGQTLRLHVAQDNGAISWYRKHGFMEVGVKSPYIQMELKPF